MTRLITATAHYCALCLRFLLCAHRARETRPTGLFGPGGELCKVYCPTCQAHWTEYAPLTDC